MVKTLEFLGHTRLGPLNQKDDLIQILFRLFKNELKGVNKN